MKDRTVDLVDILRAIFWIDAELLAEDWEATLFSNPFSFIPPHAEGFQIPQGESRSFKGWSLLFASTLITQSDEGLVTCQSANHGLIEIDCNTTSDFTVRFKDVDLEEGVAALLAPAVTREDPQSDT